MFGPLILMLESPDNRGKGTLVSLSLLAGGMTPPPGRGQQHRRAVLNRFL